MKGLLRTMDSGMGRLLCIYGAEAVICLLAALASVSIDPCALILDSLLVLYLVIRLLRYWKQLENRRLVRNLRYFFYAFGFVLVMIIFLQGPADFMKAAEQVRNGNTGITTSDFTLTGLLLVLRTFAAYLPTAAELLARVCAGSLVLILGFMVCCNLMNLLFQSGSYDSFFTVNIPLNYIGFSLILLLVSRNLSSGRELKQDYNLFI